MFFSLVEKLLYFALEGDASQLTLNGSDCEDLDFEK